MSKIEIENLVKRYGETVAIDGISLTAEEGELTSLVGPSGCGKTTTLRCVAGLERPDEGVVKIGDQIVADPANNVFVPPQERDIGFVFQTFDAWPHMTVYENVAYPLKKRDYPKDEIEDQVMETLELAGIGSLRDKPSTQLSGGQQARVGICRALVHQPQVLLFDEPLTGLDRNLRKKMRYEIQRIQLEVGITSMYVTHSQPEAMTLGDKLCLLNTDGRIEQLGESNEIYERPNSWFAFDFFGSSVALDGRIVDDRIETELGEIVPKSLDGFSQNEEVLVGFRAQDVDIYPERPDDGQNAWQGKVGKISYLGETYETTINVAEKVFHSRARDLPDGVEEESEVFVNVEPEDVYVYGGAMA